MNGSTIGLLDFSQYLKYFENKEIKFLSRKISLCMNVIKNSYRPYKIDYLNKIREINYIKDVVITDFKSLATLFNDKKRIVADKIVVMDNLELTLFLNDREEAAFYPDIDLYDCLDFHKSKEVIFLMPRSNKKIFDSRYPDLKSQEFYKKIHIPLLKNISIKNNGKMFFRSHNFYNLENIGYLNISSFIKDKYPDAIELNIKSNENVFDFKGHIYTKKPEVYYYEQFGRLIFEFILLNKEVHWFDDPYMYNDGLKDYIDYYSLNKEQIEYMMMQKYEVRPWE